MLRNNMSLILFWKVDIIIYVKKKSFIRVSTTKTNSSFVYY